MDEIFVKMHVSARTTGLMAALGPELWHTLCCLATYMDEQGYCYPSVEQLGEALNIGSQAASRRLKKLCEFRWNDKPIICRTKKRIIGGQFANYRYNILPNSQLSIFNGFVDLHVNYADYLKSDHWQDFRKKALKHYGYKCVICNAKEKLEVHHNTYERLWHEKLTDVAVVCRDCHQRHHDKFPEPPELDG